MKAHVLFKRFLTTMLVVSLVPLALSCGGGGAGDGASSGGGAYTSVTITIGSRGSAVAANAIPAGVTTIRFTVSGEGMSTVERIVEVNGMPYVQETFDVPTGYSRTFQVEALNSSGQLLYIGTTTTDLLGDPVAVAVFMHVPPVSPGAFSIVGTWGYAELEHDPFAFFGTGAGFATFNSDGTGSVAFTEDFTGAVVSGTDPTTYSNVSNGDGSYTFTDDDGSGPHVSRLIPSEDGQIALFDDTVDTAEQSILVPLKMDTARTYSNADINGSYYVITYGAMSGIFQSASSTWTADGAGNYTESGSTNENGSIFPILDSGNYSVNADGSFILTPNLMPPTGIGHVTADGKIGVISTPLSLSEWTFALAMKRGDMSYSTADLAGTWVLIGFGESFGAIALDEVGRVDCDASGNCSGTVKYQASDGSSATVPISETYSVASDGSFGGSLPGGASPIEAAAIGYSGNVIIMNRSFNPSMLNERNILIGVRCSSCGSFTP